jgi:hypothetical protein
MTPKQICRYLCFKVAWNRFLYSTGIAFIQFARFRSRKTRMELLQEIKNYLIWMLRGDHDGQRLIFRLKVLHSLLSIFLT